MDIQHIHKLFLDCSGVSIDTRKIAPRSMFIAIKGERFDANTFAQEALDKGASYVIIDNPDFLIDDRTIAVKDSLSALQQLSKFHREYLKISIIALTGSNGKTTTKELIHAVLSKKFNTKATIGNLNNHIGVPLTLLSFDSRTEIGIVEMGANHQKEIEFLCELANPDYGYITNFGKAHLEGFGGVEGVIKGKSEMYEYLSKHGKMAFVNLEDKIQVEKTSAIKTFNFGINKKSANVNISKITANPFVEVAFNNTRVSSHLIGLYNANNINAAITIGKFFEVLESNIKSAIEAYIPENNRSQLITKGSNEIILDAYNANPSSMAVAIQNFVQLDKPKKLMILGDMFELGNESLSEHKAIIESLTIEDHVDCIFVGKDFYYNKIQKSNFKFHQDYDELAADIKSRQPRDSVILIKGSRGMALERVLEMI